MGGVQGLPGGGGGQLPRHREQQIQKLGPSEAQEQGQGAWVLVNREAVVQIKQRLWLS